ncbi:putative DNA binding domain-containing protein [Butyrivibrio fibrisolvens]|uniref:ATP-binding protein n=1 Tax=Pseudobutyrivibrio ruminis TaxID=46206 RepID=UPI0003FF087D|nr:ATP-binding protein [Pseudobutyrivibrio ruminis]MDC7279124.1 putative DNA binding domain-containing protein [Butyrivibrio fibrisolvens]
MENKYLEYKESVTKRFLKTVSAFANYEGGKIIFGIDDNGKELGLEEPVAEKLKIEEMINSNLKPIPEYELSIHNKSVILEVQPGKNKPYFYENKAYKRSDTSTVEMDTFELKNLIIEGINIDFEEVKSRNQNLEFLYLENAFKKELKIEGLNKDVLKTLRLFNDKDGFNMAAYLLSDNLEGVGIDAIKFGQSINEIVKRITLTNGSILKQFDKIEEIYEDYYVVEKIEGLRREIVEKIPRAAFREAVANALVHRQWNINANVQISMFDNRIEIVSPGGLPSGITKEEYINGRYSLLRNPILADVFLRLNLIEKFGTGIIRIKSLYSDYIAQPSFVVNEGSIMVTLPTIDSIDLTENEFIVLKYIRENGPISSGQVVSELGIERNKTIETLNSLKNQGIIQVEGHGRATRYDVVR